MTDDKFERGDWMAYNAQDVAGFLVNTYMDMSRPTSNMKLQKLLYYAWAEYYRENRKYLFENKIYAWRFGPVVPEVYYEYSKYAATPITSPADGHDGRQIDERTKDFLRSFAEKYKDHTAGGLVYKAHHPGGPWSLRYREGSYDTTIPFSLIVEHINDP